MPNNKRILLLVTQADWGGVQSFLVRFGADLMKEGHTVLLAAGGEGELWANAKAKGIPCHQLRYMTRELSLKDDVQGTREVIALIDEFKPDAIHLNSSKMGVIGSLAAKFSKTHPRVVYRIGGWSFLEPMAAWKQWTYRTSEYLTAGMKDVIITVHPNDEALARELNFRPRERITTAANGIEIDTFVPALYTRADARAKLGIPENIFVFGTVANPYPAKALPAYLDVVDSLLSKDAGILAIILGGGAGFEELVAKRDTLKNKDRILLPGRRDDATKLYTAFDCFVLPSIKEGMPWAVLEAMSAGNPCITTNVGACKWMVESEDGNCGIVVPASDPIALEEAMKTLKNDPERCERFSKAAREAIIKRFTWKNTYQGNRDAVMG